MSRSRKNYTPDPVISLSDAEAKQADETQLGHALPTAAEIAAQCERLRTGWSKEHRRAARVQHNPSRN